MILYLLRHEERDLSSPLYFEPLTQNGLQNSQLLKNKLNKLGITQIYSSPFLRTLQTIEPYINQPFQHKKLQGFLLDPPQKIKIEYALYEYISKNIFNENNFLNSPPNIWINKFKIDEQYKSHLNKYSLKYPENIYKLKSRIKYFLRHILEKYKNTNEVILFVTHQQIIHSILEIINLPIPQNGIPMGALIRVV